MIKPLAIIATTASLTAYIYTVGTQKKIRQITKAHKAEIDRTYDWTFNCAYKMGIDRGRQLERWRRLSNPDK